MRTLRRLLTILPLAFMVNCKFFLPPTPDPITPNTNHAPIANLSSTPESGYSPLTTNISLSGTDEDGDAITEYQVEIVNGTIDETISQSTPIQISRTFNVGDVKIYGQCKDDKGLSSDKKNIEVIVSEPISGDILPTANLSVSPTSGQYPLTTNISLSGTDSDGIVVGYKVEIDNGDDGTIDETISQSTPISNISRTFNEAGNVKISGTVTDDKGGKTKKSVSVNALERTDLVGNITFASSYNVGSKFNFSGEIQNSTNNEITIDNSIKDSLEYKLIKEGTTVSDKKFDQSGVIILHEKGKITLDYEGDNLTYTFFNAKVNGNDFLNGIPITISSPSYIFTESGQYHIETIIKYSMGALYQVKLDSQSFNVNNQ